MAVASLFIHTTSSNNRRRTTGTVGSSCSVKVSSPYQPHPTITPTPSPAMKRVLNKNPSPTQVTAEQLLRSIYQNTSNITAGSTSHFYSGVQGSHYDYISGRQMPKKGYYGAEGLVTFSHYTEDNNNPSNQARLSNQLGLPTHFGVDKKRKRTEGGKDTLELGDNLHVKRLQAGLGKVETPIHKKANGGAKIQRNRQPNAAASPLVSWFLSSA